MELQPNKRNKLNKLRKPNKPEELNKPNKLFPFALCFLMGLIVLSVSEFAHADIGDILSRFQFYAVAEETYDTNVDLTPRNEREDFITNVGVGVRFSTLPRAETTREFKPPSTGEETAYGINLDFLPTYVYYAKGTSDDYLALSGKLETWYTWDQRLTFRARDYVFRSEEPLEPSYSAGALPNEILLGTQRGRSIYIRNVFEASSDYRFGTEDLISINYINNVYRNESSFFEDSTENYINPRLTYWFNLRNGILLEYALDLGNFQRSPDMTGHLARGRYTYRFNPRTSIFGQFGYLRRDFEPPSTDYDAYQPSLGIEHAFSPTLSGRAQFGYFHQDPERGTTTDGFSYDVSVTQRAKRTTYTLLFQGGYTEVYFTAENLGFTKYNSAIGTITHQLTERVSATLSARYQRPEYDDGRTDNIWGVSGDTSYQVFRWVNVGINLSYAESRSNRDFSDYTDLRATFRITATY
jgi:hypothetical protein